MAEFLTKDEVDALLKGVTGEPDEDDWARAMAEQSVEDTSPMFSSNLTKDELLEHLQFRLQRTKEDCKYLEGQIVAYEIAIDALKRVN